MSLSCNSTRLELQTIIERRNTYASIAQRNGCYTALGADSLPDTSGPDPAQHFDPGLSHWNHAFRGRGLGTERARPSTALKISPSLPLLPLFCNTTLHLYPKYGNSGCLMRDVN